MESYLFAQSIRQQLLNQGYKMVIKENNQGDPYYCFLTKRNELPPICKPTKFLPVNLNEDFALEIIKDHFETRIHIIKSLPTHEQLHSVNTINDDRYFFEISEYSELKIYHVGQMIDYIDFSEEDDFQISIKEFVLEILPIKEYFTVSLGYALMHFLQSTYPFENHDLGQILYKYEARESCFEQACLQSGNKYVPNLNLQEKCEYLESYDGGYAGKCKYAITCHDYSMYKADVNMYHKMVQLGFIITNPFGEIYEPIKIDKSI
jgi:hypothetical protein